MIPVMTRSRATDVPIRPAALTPASAGVVGAALLLALAACAGSSRSTDSPVAASDTVRGTVRQVGSTPFVRTVVEGTDTVTVTGDPESELARLSGARVRVVGTLSTGEYPGPTLDVATYEILSVDGERPAVGTLRSDRDGLFLERPEREPLRLRAVTSSLGRNVGAKIWVITGDDGSVRRYGVLRPPEQQ